MLVDLHVHSTASDGCLAPIDLVAQAADRNVRVLSITDHDSVDGIEAAASAAHSHELILIPGVEISASHQDQELHILGYCIDPSDISLSKQLRHLRVVRTERAARTVALMRDHGLDMNFHDIEGLFECSSVGRSHLARTLVIKGIAEDVSDAFNRFLGFGRPFYIPKECADPTRLIRLIKRAGGLAVLAHPGISGVDDLVPHFVESGLAGIEVYHPLHSKKQTAHYKALASYHNLVCTGGSDYHGCASESHALGIADLSASEIIAFLRSAPDKSYFDAYRARSGLPQGQHFL